jgi:hypothetical protein
MTEAISALQEVTEGVMSDKVIMVPSVMYGELMAEAMALTSSGLGSLLLVADVTNEDDVRNAVDATVDFARNLKGVTRAADAYRSLLRAGPDFRSFTGLTADQLLTLNT